MCFNENHLLNLGLYDSPNSFWSLYNFGRPEQRRIAKVFCAYGKKKKFAPQYGHTYKII